MFLLNSFLQKNPTLLSKYVSLGCFLVDKTVGPLNTLLQHLLEIQGIDPRTQPGERTVRNLVTAIGTADDKMDYDPFFDFGPVLKAFDKTKDRLKHLQINKDQFKKITDLTHAVDVPSPLQATKKWDPVKTEAIEYDNALDDLKAFMDKYHVASTTLPVTTDHLNDALETLKKYAEKLGDQEKSEKFDSARQPTVVGRGRKTKSSAKTVKSFKKGCFRRVEDE